MNSKFSFHSPTPYTVGDSFPVKIEGKEYPGKVIECIEEKNEDSFDQLYLKPKYKIILELPIEAKKIMEYCCSAFISSNSMRKE